MMNNIIDWFWYMTFFVSIFSLVAIIAAVRRVIKKENFTTNDKRAMMIFIVAVSFVISFWK